MTIRIVIETLIDMLTKKGTEKEIEAEEVANIILPLKESVISGAATIAILHLYPLMYLLHLRHRLQVGDLRTLPLHGVGK